MVSNRPPKHGIPDYIDTYNIKGLGKEMETTTSISRKLKIIFY
jgi:hypothetical protein